MTDNPRRLTFIENEPHRYTIARARFEVRRHADDGVICPCCDRLVKLYREKLYSGMAASLIWLVQEYANTHDWVAVRATAPRHVLRSAKIGKLRRWGLVFSSTETPGDGRKTAGLYKPTIKGIDFAHGRIAVPAYSLTLNDQVIAFDGDMIDVRQALGNKFDYDELFPAHRRWPENTQQQMF